jgi:hypothetical protein
MFCQLVILLILLNTISAHAFWSTIVIVTSIQIMHLPANHTCYTWGLISACASSNEVTLYLISYKHSWQLRSCRVAATRFSAQKKILALHNLIDHQLLATGDGSVPSLWWRYLVSKHMSACTLPHSVDAHLIHQNGLKVSPEYLGHLTRPVTPFCNFPPFLSALYSHVHACDLPASCLLPRACMKT